MSWPDVPQNDGYTEHDNKNEPGNDLWESRGGIDIESCKAICNNNSACKSIAHGKSNNVCFLKSSGGTNLQNDTNIKFYVKNGEPVNNQKMYYTQPAAPVNSWASDMFQRNNNNCDQPQGGTPVQVGLDISNNRSCAWIPFAKNMCPAIGDFRYFRHSQASSSNVANYSYFDNYKNNFGRPGTQTSLNQNAPVVCGYNRIDRDKWDDLVSRYNFSQNEAKRVIKDHCTGEGVTSSELYSDTTCKFKLSETEYYQSILDKLKSESNWWNDNTKVGIFEDIATNKKAGNAQKIIDVLNSLPTTGWSDRLVGCLNALVEPTTQSDSGVLQKIKDKVKAYCNASNGNTNSKCACFNAITYELSRCTNNIIGCEEAVKYESAINEIARDNPSFASQFRSNYSAHRNSKSCQRTGKTDNILKYEQIPQGAQTQNLALCLSKIENSGTINADTIRAVCSAQVTNTTSDDSDDSDSSSASKSSSSSSSSSSKNTIWIILVVIISCVILAIGGGLLFMSSSGNS